MRLWLGVWALLGLAGCRRQEAPPYASDVPLPAPSAPAPSAPADLAPASATGHERPASASAPRLPDGGTLNGDARGPRAGDFNRVVDSVLPRLRHCFDVAGLPAGESNVVVHYIVEPPGYTGGVTVRGSAPAPVQACAKAALLDLKFPGFRGAKVENDLPFSYKTTATPAAPVEIFDLGPR